MKLLKFYFRQFGKSCGHIGCKGRGYFPAYYWEKYEKGFWVSCGRIHNSKVGA